jgi:hypothetical protein
MSGSFTGAREQRGGAGHQARDVGGAAGLRRGLVREQPARELDGVRDDGGRARLPSGGVGPERGLDVAPGEELLDEHGRVLEGLRGALGEGRRGGVRGVAGEHDPAAVPRRVDDVVGEPGVVHPRRVGHPVADLGPRAAVVAGELAHRREPLVG